MNILPHRLILDPLINTWLREDVGRGDRTAQGLSLQQWGQAQWLAKETGVIAGMPIAARVFELLSDQVQVNYAIAEGNPVQPSQVITTFNGPLDVLLMGERVALNLAMRLSGIATATQKYTEVIADLPTQLVDTRKTTPGLRILEKYATRVGGAVNHRMGLDDAVMIKDNHIKAAGGIKAAIDSIRRTTPYPLTIEVETTTLEEVNQALEGAADIIMLDNMELALMKQAVQLIRNKNVKVKIEASGNVSLTTIRSIAETGVDYISSSAPITRSPWLDLSMRVL
ncbi:MAG: carboxylating nicotinate-nucleotide diphosphorylase [cyanobacterium endosymbiont of Rhopalodia gibba]|jgi:nicotinate-nucleotide pyrophosphorylase (carboxylating)